MPINWILEHKPQQWWTQEIEPKTSFSNTMSNYRFSQKLKLLGDDEFIHLT